MLPTEVVLADRFRLESRIAVGGMGEAWRAVDLVTRLPVAVKVLSAEYAWPPQTLARIRAVAQRISLVAHPGIVRIYYYGDGDPAVPPYLVMELVEGPSLAGVLANGPLAPARAMDVIGQAAAALDAAHQAGAVHGDIKPSNILIGRGGQVKIIDFGIAVAAGSAPLTRSGPLKGSPGYLAPERAAGAPATPASDLYSLGVVAYECLVGTRPFRGSPLEIVAAHRHIPLPALPDSVPGTVAVLVTRTTAKDPPARPGNADQVSWWAFQLRDSLIRQLGSQPRPRPPGLPGPEDTAPIYPAVPPHPARAPYPAESPHSGAAPYPGPAPYRDEGSYGDEPPAADDAPHALDVPYAGDTPDAGDARYPYEGFYPGEGPRADEGSYPPGTSLGRLTGSSRPALPSGLGPPPLTGVGPVLPVGGMRVHSPGTAAYRWPGEPGQPGQRGWAGQRGRPGRPVRPPARYGRYRRYRPPASRNAALAGAATAVVILVAVIAAGIFRGASAEKPLTTGSGSATHAAHSVQVRQSALVGHPARRVVRLLRKLGLKPHVVRVITSAQPAGRVVSVHPGGRVAIGSTVTVTVAARPAPPPSVVASPGSGGGADGGGD